MELGGRQHSLAALLLEKRRKLRNNEKSSTKMDKWRARTAFKSSQRRNGLVGPNFRAGRRRTHTHTHTHIYYKCRSNTHPNQLIGKQIA